MSVVKRKPVLLKNKFNIAFVFSEFETMQCENKNEIMHFLLNLKYGTGIIHICKILGGDDQDVVNPIKCMVPNTIMQYGKYLPTILENSSCICYLLNKQTYAFLEIKSPVFFKYIPEHMKQNINIVCYFYYTIRQHLTMYFSKYQEDMLTMLNNGKFTGTVEYFNVVLDLIPNNRRKELFLAIDILHNRYTEPIFEMFDIYILICQLMHSFSIDTFTRKMTAYHNTSFSFD